MLQPKGALEWDVGFWSRPLIEHSGLASADLDSADMWGLRQCLDSPVRGGQSPQKKKKKEEREREPNTHPHTDRPTSYPPNKNKTRLSIR